MNCKNILLVSLLFATPLQAEQTLNAGGANLSVRQIETIPLLERDDDTVVFSIEVAASCDEGIAELALVASIADTLVDAVGDDALPLTTVAMRIPVPAAQLAGMQRALLCERLAKSTDNAATALIRGAFNVQVVSICSTPGRDDQQRTVNAPLDVIIDCAASPGAGARPGS